MSSLLGVRFSGPLQLYAQGFADELRRQGYKITGAKGQLFLAAHLSRWLADRGLQPAVLAMPEVVEEFFADRRAAGYTNYRTVKALAPLLTYLRGLDVVGPPPVVELTPAQVLLERYRSYLTGERGLAATTARGYIDAVRGFVTGRQVNGELRLADVTAAEVTGFVVETCAGQTRGSAKMTVTALRSLLGFLYVDGTLENSLVAAVPSVASRRLAGLPKGLAPSARRSLAGRFGCAGHRKTAAGTPRPPSTTARPSSTKNTAAPLPRKRHDRYTVPVHGSGSTPHSRGAPAARAAPLSTRRSCDTATSTPTTTTPRSLVPQAHTNQGHSAVTGTGS